MTGLRGAAAGLGLGALLALSGCGNGPPAPAGGVTSEVPGHAGKTGVGTATVMVQGTDQDQFAPNTSPLKVGDVIQWSNAGSHVHDVTFDNYQPLSGSLGPGDTWQVTFTKPGTYDYHCTFHPKMTATLTVS